MDRISIFVIQSGEIFKRIWWNYMEMLKIIFPGLVFLCKPTSLASSRNILHFLSVAAKFRSIDVSHRGNVWNLWKFTRKSCYAINMARRNALFWVSVSTPRGLGAFFLNFCIFRLSNGTAFKKLASECAWRLLAFSFPDYKTGLHILPVKSQFKHILSSWFQVKRSALCACA